MSPGQPYLECHYSGWRRKRLFPHGHKGRIVNPIAVLTAVYGILSVFPITLFVADNRLRLATVAAAVLATITLPQLIRGSWTLSHSNHRWLKWFILWLVIAVIGLLLSPYLAVSAAKGLSQLAGVSAHLVAAVGISVGLAQSPGHLYRTLRIVVFAAVLVAAIGAFQFVVINIVGRPDVVSFEWLNDLAGGPVWRPPGQIGGLFRANSLLPEPASLGRLCAVFLGLAVQPAVHVDLADRRHRWRPIGRGSVVLLWIGLLVSLSLLAYVMAGLAVAFTILITRRRPAILSGLLGLAAIVAVVPFSALPIFGGLSTKASTVGHAIAPLNSTDFSPVSVSSLALNTNRIVALESLSRRPLVGIGLGSHPAAYDDTYFGTSPYILGLNSEDAASLGLRLASETGLIGVLMFAAGFGSLYRKARRVYVADTELGRRTILAGLVASSGAVLVADFLRFGQYYDPLTWLLVGLIAAYICCSEAG